MARLRRLLVTLAVAALLPVATTALAGRTRLRRPVTTPTGRLGSRFAGPGLVGVWQGAGKGRGHLQPLCP